MLFFCHPSLCITIRQKVQINPYSSLNVMSPRSHWHHIIITLINHCHQYHHHIHEHHNHEYHHHNDFGNHDHCHLLMILVDTLKHNLITMIIIINAFITFQAALQ